MDKKKTVVISCILILTISLVYVIATTYLMPSNSRYDDDGDGLFNDQEAQLGTNPKKSDSDNDGVSDYDEIYVTKTDPLVYNESQLSNIEDEPAQESTPNVNPSDSAVDTDDDGISDGDEIKIGTNINNVNTDGDRYDDGEEFYQLIPSYVEEPGSSPLNPAYPDLKIELSNRYNIWLKTDLSTATETVESDDYEYSINTQETITTDFSNQLTVKVGYNLADLGVSVTDQFDFAHSTSLVTNTNQRHLMASAKSWSEMKTTDLGDSYLYITMRITNIGTDILETEPTDIWLSLYVGSDNDPIKTWSFGSSYQGARIAPLKPEETRTINVEFHNCLSVNLLERIDSGEPVRFEVQNYDLGGDREYLQNVKDTTIQLDVDNGDFVETYYCLDDSLSLTDFLTKHADMIIDGNVIRSIDALPNNENNWWEIILPSEVDVPSNILDATVSKGEQVVLIYQRDADNDGIMDRTELIMGLNPNSEDTDNDGINDFDEIYAYGTDPLNDDSDFDGLNDKEEISEQSDGYITNPLSNDSDSDGLTDYEELTYKTNPNNSDTDSDGLSDKTEIQTHNTNPTKSDTDGDTLSDGNEVSNGSNPTLVDSDGDSISDGNDIDPTRDLILYIDLERMEATTDDFPADELFTTLDVTFQVTVYDSQKNQLKVETIDCPDDTLSYVLNERISCNVPDDNPNVFVRIDAWERDTLSDDDLDVSGGSNFGSELIYAYFSFDLRTNMWQEIYGGDPSSSGRISGLDDGIQNGGQVTLWYSISK